MLNLMATWLHQARIRSPGNETFACLAVAGAPDARYAPTWPTVRTVSIFKGLKPGG